MSRNWNTLQCDKAREHRRKYGPKMPTKALARILFKDNPLIYRDVEDARGRLRYIEGKCGNTNRKTLFDRSLVIKEDRPKNPYNLPISDETIYDPFIIKGHKRIGILSDIHAPYHSMTALTAAMDYLKKEKPDALLFNGDIIDCHQLSRFVRDPKKRNFKLELDTFKSLFDIFEKVFKCKIYFKFGNHEERYENFLFQKAPELVGIEEFEFSNIIKARARGIEIITDKRYMLLNTLVGIHGHEYIGGLSSPVNPARGLFNKGKVSAFQGHNHQASEHTEPTLTGKVITTWSLGCLSELHPAYVPLNKWSHGFGIVDLDPNGEDYEFRNKKIIKGAVR